MAQGTYIITTPPPAPAFLKNIYPWTAFVWFILFCSKFRSTTSDEPNNQQTEGPLEINHIPELKKISTFIEKRTHNMHNVASNFGALNGAS